MHNTSKWKIIKCSRNNVVVKLWNCFTKHYIMTLNYSQEGMPFLNHTSCLYQISSILTRHTRCWNQIDIVDPYLYAPSNCVSCSRCIISGLSMNVCRFHSFFLTQNIFVIRLPNFLMYDIIFKEIVCSFIIYEKFSV